MRTGLVLEGGGMRGLFSAGVMDVMLENDVQVDGVVGVSAGACFGCNYVSRQIGRALRYNINMTHEPRYMGWRPLLTEGNIMGGEFAYHTLPDELDPFDKETFAGNPTEFHVVCTDVYTGAPIYKRLQAPVDYEFMEWIRASSALPLVSKPVAVGGKLMLDGGMSDSIPLKYFQEQGFERNIVILTQPKGFKKKRTKLMPLFKTLMRKYPAIIDAMNNRHIMYNGQLDYLAQEEKTGRIIVVAPEDTLPIGRTEQNVEKMKVVYQMGREAGLRLLEKIK